MANVQSIIFPKVTTGIINSFISNKRSSTFTLRINLHYPRELRQSICISPLHHLGCCLNEKFFSSFDIERIDKSEKRRRERLL